MKTRLLLSLLMLLGCLLAAGCGHKANPDKNADSDTSAATPVVQVSAAQRGSIEQTLPATGTLMALRTQEATLTPPIAGILEALPVHFGQSVQKGQIVAQLSARPLLGQIQQAQAVIAQNQVQVQQAEANAVQQQAQTQTAIAQAGSAVAGAKAALAGAQATLIGNAAALRNAQQGLARVQTLYSDGLVAQKDVEAARLAVQTAAAQAAAQQQTVDAQRETVRSQQLALLAAEAARLQNSVKQKDVNVAQQQVRNARGALATLQAQAALFTLRSPLAGTVTSVGANLGENVDTATKLITVVNLDTLQLQIAVPAESAHQVHIGQPISFQADSVPGKVFSGTIRAVTTQVDPASNTVQALAVIQNPRHVLADDAFAQIRITVQKHSSALLVPQSAVLRDAGGQVTIATLSADNTTHLKEVKTGLTQGSFTEILSGIQPGERVVTTGAYGLPDGTKVTVAEGKPAR